VITDIEVFSMEDRSWWFLETFEDDSNLVEDLVERDDDIQAAHGGSTKGKAANKDRGRESAALRMYADYFASSPV
jgi:hypothetical protein